MNQKVKQHAQLFKMNNRTTECYTYQLSYSIDKLGEALAMHWEE